MAFFWITQREWERATAKIEQLEERTVANTKLLERHADAIDKIHEARSKPFKTLGYMLKVAVPALAAVLLVLVSGCGFGPVRFATLRPFSPQSCVRSRSGVPLRFCAAGELPNPRQRRILLVWWCRWVKAWFFSWHCPRSRSAQQHTTADLPTGPPTVLLRR